MCIRDSDKVLIANGAGDAGTRGWVAALEARTGKELWRWYIIPAPGEPGSETWKDKNNAWQTGGGAMWITGSYDPASNQVIWGTGNPVPMFDPTYRPGDNLYTNSMISWLSLIHISEPTRQAEISYAVFCLKK